VVKIIFRKNEGVNPTSNDGSSSSPVKMRTR